MSKIFAKVNGLHEIFNIVENDLGQLVYNTSNLKDDVLANHGVDENTIFYIETDSDDHQLDYKGTYIYSHNELFSNYDNKGGQYIQTNIDVNHNDTELGYAFGKITPLASNTNGLWNISYHIQAYSSNTNYNSEYDVCLYGYNNNILGYYAFNAVGTFKPYLNHVIVKQDNVIKVGLSFIADSIDRKISIIINDYRNCSFEQISEPNIVVEGLNVIQFDATNNGFDQKEYAPKNHTHTISISKDTGSTSITPQGTVSVSITGRPTTFTGNFTPQGTISVGTFGYTSTDATISSTLAVINGAHTHSVNMSTSSIGVTYAKSNANTGSTSPAVTGSITASYTPTGTISVVVGTQSASASLTGITSPSHSHSFTGSATTFTGSFTPTGTIGVSITTASANADITKLSSPSHSHSFTGSSTTFTGSFTPAGTITKPGITPTLTSASVTYATGAKTLTSESFSQISGVLAYSAYSADSETLTLTSHSAAAYSTNKYLTNVTLTTTTFTNITGVTAALNAAPTFTGTEETISVSGTPKGTIGGSAVTFSGTISYVKPTDASGTFYGTAGNISASGTPKGTIGGKSVTIEGGSISYIKPTGEGEGTFYGASTTITSSFTLSAANHSHTVGTTDTTVYGTMPSITIGAASSTPSLGGGIKVTYDKLTSASAKFTGTAGTVNVSGTPLFNAPVATFTGTASSHSHSFDSGTITTSTEKA